VQSKCIIYEIVVYATYNWSFMCFLGFGFTNLDALLLTAPAAAITICGQLIVAYTAAHTKNLRCYLMAGCQLFVLTSGLLLWNLPRNQIGALLFAIYILPMYGGTYLIALGLSLANCAGNTKRVVYSAGLFVGYCFGNIAGPLYVCYSLV
jgi:hypothetical protein